MKKRRLWPLLPPVGLLVMMCLFLTGKNWMSGSSTQCSVRKFTDLFCPGCGGTRCLEDIFQGHLLSAINHNAMLAISFFAFITGSIFLIVRVTLLGKPAPHFSNIHPFWMWCGLGGIALFTILRNIPSQPFSALAP